MNTNLLTDHELLDGLSGNAVLNGIPVALVKDAGGHRAGLADEAAATP